MKNKKAIGILVLVIVVTLVFLIAGPPISPQTNINEKEIPTETSTEESVPEGDLELQNVLSLETTTPHSQPLNAEIQISNNSNHRIQRLMINVFINDELYKRYYLNEGLNKNSNLTYEINDLIFREDQIGFNQVKFEIVPLQEFIDSKPENNEKTIPIEVFTY